MIDAGTDLYCIFGSPVRHSKSPLIHNALFQHHGINAAYLAFEIKNIAQGIKAVKTLGIKGASITIPFKEAVIPFLDEIAPDAREMGAVNTVVNLDGVLHGHNTDCMGAVTPLQPFGIKDKKVIVLGAGGAAMAVVYGIRKFGGKCLVVNRTPEKARKLARRFQCSFMELDEFNNQDQISADIVINTTSVGMVPDTQFSLVPESLLTPGMVAMDIVYTPLETMFLKQARGKNCRIVDGLSMFLHQGAAQFKLWTGIKPEVEIMRCAMMENLETKP